ncbi:MAG: gliding motility-associated C-terminal domain-containing protein [Flavobacteriales bacterium]|nr:gliding motility-associated C-terminal domain-containing protein [Flavobacteriales bacterium]
MTVAVLLGLSLGAVSAQVTTQMEWQRCIGGSGFDDPGPGFTRTDDGGFVVVGWSDSNDGDVTGDHGSLDILVTKLDANGSAQWSRALGGSEAEFGVSCIEASDGSLYVMGNTGSVDGDVTGNLGLQGIWMVKLSAQGTLLWQRTYGGSGSENAVPQLRRTPDGGFMLHGLTTSDDGDVTDLNGPGEQDHWIVKLDAAGDIEWNRTLGGSGAEYGINVIPTTDGGYIVNFAYTRSNDGDVVNNHGEDDLWLVKLNVTGAIVWSLTLGGSDFELGMDAVVLPDGDIVILGHTKSTDGDVQENQGNYDVLLARVSSGGTLLWTRTYGGSQNETASDLLTTADGGFLVMASANSNDGDVTGAHGGQDMWVLKVNGNGDLLWQRAFGGSAFELGILAQTTDAGYLLCGSTFSGDGNIEGHHGQRDLWLAQINEQGDLVWQRCLGGSSEDQGWLRAELEDGSLVSFGYTESNDGDVSGNHGGRDLWVVKLRVDDPERPAEPLDCAIFVPNAFSPDASSKNDRHCVNGTECMSTMTLSIYDRWGNRVFESTDPRTCWDGQYKGQLLDPAVFVYHLSAILTNGDTVERQGNITLVR